jgi:hypothetical protein
MWKSVNSFWKRRVRPIWEDRVGGGLILAAILALIVAIYGQLSGSTARLLDWLSDRVIISRWLLPAEFAGGILLALTAVLLGRWQLRTKTKPTFAPMLVCDPKYPIEWHIDAPLRTWLSDSRVSRYTPGDQKRILSGPYHADCKAELDADYDNQTSDFGPDLLPECPVCEVQLFALSDQEDLDPDLFAMRLEAIKELQRMARNNVPIKTGMALERPLYWKRIKPLSKRS